MSRVVVGVVVLLLFGWSFVDDDNMGQNFHTAHAPIQWELALCVLRFIIHPIMCLLSNRFRETWTDTLLLLFFERIEGPIEWNVSFAMEIAKWVENESRIKWDILLCGWKARKKK